VQARKYRRARHGARVRGVDPDGTRESVDTLPGIPRVIYAGGALLSSESPWVSPRVRPLGG